MQVEIATLQQKLERVHRNDKIQHVQYTSHIQDICQPMLAAISQLKRDLAAVRAECSDHQKVYESIQK